MTTPGPIPTQDALTGFIATDPVVKYTSKGEARLYFRVGHEYWSKDTDGQWRTHQESTYHHVSVYGAAALKGRDQLRKGDWILLVGRTRSYTHSDGTAGHEFAAWSYGPDAKRLSYRIERDTGPTTSPPEHAPAPRTAATTVARSSQTPTLPNSGPTL